MYSFIVIFHHLSKKGITMEDIHQNQTGILNIDVYDYLKVAVVGCGSIGSFLAVALNKLGFNNIMLIDDDTVEPHNTATQFYLKEDVNQFKVEMLSNYLTGHITTHILKVEPNMKIQADVVFVCVDSLKARKTILKSILDSNAKFKQPTLIIDGRMHRLVFRVFTVPLNNQEVLKLYTKSLMEKEFVGPCTEKGIIQNVFGVVSIMLEQLKKTMNGEKFYAVINYDLENYAVVLQNETTPKPEVKR
jgi:molybdopterin/thiamine biosynthesis adenylyltransferase